MYLDTIEVFLAILRFVMGRDNNSMDSFLNQCSGKIIGPDGAATLWNLKVLMKDQDFHDAKKAFRLMPGEIIFSGQKKIVMVSTTMNVFAAGNRRLSSLA